MVDGAYGVCQRWTLRYPRYVVGGRIVAWLLIICTSFAPKSWMRRLVLVALACLHYNLTMVIPSCSQEIRGCYIWDWR